MSLYLTEQVLTYMGNKRALLKEIDEVIEEVQKDLNKDVSKIKILDLFSGSGIVARLFKEKGYEVHANDLEAYSYIINSCYLSNKSDVDLEKLQQYNDLILEILNQKNYKTGIISEMYAPKKDEDIQEGERAFYTHENAERIDTIRSFIDTVDEEYKKYLLAPLLIEASIHANTSGVFKGFYKDSKTGKGKFGGNGENALTRIKGEITLPIPIFSDIEGDYFVYQKDANELSKELKGLDIVYMDPPYNQHPYGSNYFMLNVILKNKIDSEISKVSGIPNDWNRSNFNKKNLVKESLESIIKEIDSKYIIVSYNSEGFITLDEMKTILEKYGELKIKEIQYNTFRGSRNLKNREKYVLEYLFVLKKYKK